MSAPLPPRRRMVTLAVHYDDDARATRTIRLPVRLLQGGVALVALGVATLVAILLLYAPLVRAAARAPALEHRVRQLEQENAKVQELALALDSAQAGYARLRQMVGADIVPAVTEAAGRADSAGVPERPATTLAPASGAPAPGAASRAGAGNAASDTSASPASPAPGAPGAPGAASTASVELPRLAPIRARAPGADTTVRLTLPERWPLAVRGFVTRGQVRAGGPEPDETHPGLDIAIPVGTVVRASGGGVVERTGADSSYGRFVLLGHPDGYATMYGHLSRAVVRAGDTVAAGQTLGLSGNSGRSTAPHLHFEIRRAGQPVDPLTLVQEPR
ncbi:MAG TPA: M23 family metallopeptidase [Gemmatimonadales bacterium]|nr:M23 family metallopeptidase [Gemmatimonadales bacterium]